MYIWSNKQEDMESKFIDYHFLYTGRNKTFSIEISEWTEFAHSKIIKLINPETGNHRLFNFVKRDTDGSNEDIYGWNYESKDGFKLLIIND